MRNTFIDTIIDAAQRREDVFIISGDAGLGVFDDYQKKMPARFLNLGVAEQNAASFSAGLALTGYKVYLYNIIPFLLYRCYEQVRNDICYQRLPVILVGIGSGITYAPQGMTHYSVEDIGVAQTLPNLRVFSPIDPVEAEAAARYSLEADVPVYVRLAKRGEPCIHTKKKLCIEHPQLLREGDGLAVLTHGSIACEVAGAVALLQKKALHPAFISVPLLQPFPEERLFEMLSGFRHVVTVEEHFVGSGLGSMMAKAYAKKRPGWQLHTLGIPDKFIHVIKDQAGMREHFGISAARIAEYLEKI